MKKHIYDDKPVSRMKALRRKSPNVATNKQLHQPEKLSRTESHAVFGRNTTDNKKSDAGSSLHRFFCFTQNLFHLMDNIVPIAQAKYFKIGRKHFILIVCIGSLPYFP